MPIQKLVLFHPLCPELTKPAAISITMSRDGLVILMEIKLNLLLYWHLHWEHTRYNLSKKRFSFFFTENAWLSHGVLDF